MGRFTFLRLFLLPSLLSGLTVMCLTIAILVTSGILYITENQLFYDYLFGIHGVATAIVRAPDSPSAMWGAVSGGSFAYYALLVMISVIAGLTIWAILQGVTKVTQEASFALNALRQARTAQKEAIQELFERLMIRVLGLIMAALYMILFVDILVPIILLLLRHGIDALDMGNLWDGASLLVTAIFLLMSCLHVHVIFARLYTLRLRIFGGADVQLAAIDQD